MSKFRIVELIHRCGEGGDQSREIVIEKKYFFRGWREVMKKEIESKRNSFDSTKEAEYYLFENYTGHGGCRKDGNVYEYTPYNYNM